jgi:hypothetical protein
MKKRESWYIITREDYRRYGLTKWGDKTVRNFEMARNKRAALRKARKMGDGAEIKAVYRRKGKSTVRTWIYESKEIS